MSIAHLLEDFTLQSNGGAVHILDEDALEEQRLAAFEKGYGAGWDDALEAQDQGRGQLSADLTASLSDLSFTYHEAIGQMQQSLQPMFQSLTRVVLPEIVERGFATRLTEQLCDMARDQIGQPIQLNVPEGTAELVEPLLPQDLTAPLRLIEDPDLAAGTAQLRVGTTHREIDCNALLSAISGAFDAYVFEAEKALSNE